MSLNSKMISPFIAACVLAGEGEYGEIEKDCVADLAADLELKDLDEKVSVEFKKVEKMDEDALDEYLETAAKAVKEGEKEGVLLICMNVLASDGVITQDEIENYFSFAEILGVEEERASEIFDEFVDEMDDLEIEA